MEEDDKNAEKDLLPDIEDDDLSSSNSDENPDMSLPSQEESKQSQASPAAPEEKPDEEQKQFLKAGIPGFDELIESGGIPRGASILVSGGPGSGKTTFCLQTLNYGASHGEKCIYLSFEESIEHLKDHMIKFGWDPNKLEAEGNLVIKRMDPFEISRSVEALLAKARGELLIELDEVEGLIPAGFKPDRIVLDSLSAVSAAFAGREEGYRIYIEQLFKALEKIGATSFLITEMNLDMNTFSKSGVEEFLSDGVIVFYNMQKGNIRVSATEIIKLRGVAHKKKIVPFSISSGKGIEVFPLEEIFVDK